MRPSRKALVLIIIIGIGLLGYSQYVATYLIDVKVTKSEFIEENEEGSTYNLQLEFDNPSFLMLNAGETDFKILLADKKIANGVLEPFVLPSMGKVVVEGQYMTVDKSDLREDEQFSFVTVSGVTKYDVLFTTIEVPFIYFPSEEQSREFIQQN